MTELWTPSRQQPPRQPSIVDTPVDAMLRDRQIGRLRKLADSYEDRAYEVASTMGMQRARYNEYWAERTEAWIVGLATVLLRRAATAMRTGV